MEIQQELRADVAVLRLLGRAMGGPEMMSFYDQIKALVSEDITKVVLDCSMVTVIGGDYMSGALMKSLVLLKKHGGDLRVACFNPQKAHYHAIGLFEVAKLFKLFDTVDEAVVSFTESPP